MARIEFLGRKARRLLKTLSERGPYGTIRYGLRELYSNSEFLVFQHRLRDIPEPTCLLPSITISEVRTPEEQTIQELCAVWPWELGIRRPEFLSTKLIRRAGEGGWCFAVRLDGRIVGAVWLTQGDSVIEKLPLPHLPGQRVCQSLFITDEARDMGLSKSLLSYALGVARSRGVPCVFSYSLPQRVAAVRAQLSVGFEVIGSVELATRLGRERYRFRPGGVPDAFSNRDRCPSSSGLMLRRRDIMTLAHRKPSRSLPAAFAILGHGPCAYEAVRSLAHLRTKTIVLTDDASRNVRYPGAEVMLCPHADAGQDMASFLNRCVAPRSQVIVFPASDRYAGFLARYGSLLDRRFLYLQSQAHVVESCLNKAGFSVHCRRIGLPCPGTFVFENQAAVRAHVDDLVLPLVIKPLVSAAWPPSLAHKGYHVRSADELLALTRKITDLGFAVLVQEWVPGDPSNNFFVGGIYDENGRPEKIYVGRKLLQHPLRIGICCLARLTWNEEVVTLANEFALRSPYSGLIDLEAKYDAREGCFKIIEVNPRLGAFHRISDDGRCNAAAYYCLRMLGIQENLPHYRPHTEGRMWVWPHYHICSRVEERGLLGGFASAMREISATRLKCGWDISDVRRTYRATRVALGRIRRLDPKTLLHGYERGGVEMLDDFS